MGKNGDRMHEQWVGDDSISKSTLYDDMQKQVLTTYPLQLRYVFDLPQFPLWVEESVALGKVLGVFDLIDVELFFHTEREPGAVVDLVSVDRDRTKACDDRKQWVEYVSG